METVTKPTLGKYLFLGAAALAAGLAAWQAAHREVSLAQNLVLYADRGEMLLHAVRSKAVGYSMPLLSLLGAAQLHLGFDPALPAGLAGLLIPLAAAHSYFSKPGGVKKWLLGSAVFLAFAYAPLLPWARLNHGLYGRIILFEEERPVSNLITGAAGSVYTIEGDARAFAGLSRTENVYIWAARTVLERPGRYALAVLKRLLRVFLLYPLLFLLAGAGLFLSRSRETGSLAFAGGYFLLVHCLLSIEERYFYPLRYILALLAAAGAWELARKAGLPAQEKRRDYFTLPLFAACAALAAPALGLVWRYPAAARPPLVALEQELKKNPGEAWLLRKKGELLLSLDLTAEGRAAMRGACALRDDPGTCYLSAALEAVPPAEPPALEDRYSLLLVKMLRELELGLDGAAGDTFKKAEGIWLTGRNAVKGGTPDENAPELRLITGNQ